MWEPILSHVTICNNTFCTFKYKNNDAKNWIVLKNVSTNIEFNDMKKKTSFVQRIKQRFRRHVLFLRINEIGVTVPLRYRLPSGLNAITYKALVNPMFAIKIYQQRCSDNNKYYTIKLKVKYHREDSSIHDTDEDVSVRSKSSNTDSFAKEDSIHGVKRRLSIKYNALNQEHTANCGARSHRHSRCSNNSSNGIPRPSSTGAIIDITI